MHGTAIILVCLAACTSEAQQREGTTSEEAPRPAATASPIDQQAAGNPRDVTYAPELGIDLDAMELQESGLYIQVLNEGEGPPAAAGDRMGVHYTVWFPDGRKLDSSRDKQPPVPLDMVLGRTRLIDGWTEGVTGMRLGEKRQLVLPYDLAYGARGRAGIPPYSVLVFEVELAEHEPGGS